MGLFRNLSANTIIKSAKTMSLRCLYDERVELDDHRRLNIWKETVNDTITVKSDKNICHCTVEVPKDLLHYKEHIIDWIKAGGYKCVDLSTTDITNDQILFIEWKYDYKTMGDKTTAEPGVGSCNTDERGIVGNAKLITD